MSIIDQTWFSIESPTSPSQDKTEVFNRVMNNPDKIILASSSQIRQSLLRNARVPFEINIGKIDEELIKSSLIAEGVPPRDIADALAEGKARKVSSKFPASFVIGCDQTLSFRGALVTKAKTPDIARETLRQMRGERHKLFSAAVIYHEGEPIWRHVSEARLTMFDFSDEYLDSYIERTWDDIKYCVGSYMFEGEGIRLFSHVEGDYFTILGLPLLQLLAYLRQREVIET